MGAITDIIPESDSAFTTAARVLLGLFLLGLGVATFFVPDVKVSFMSQLDAAGIPLRNLTSFVLPTLEGIVGVMLLWGVMMRLASLMSIVLMALLTYLHLVVDEPTLFGEQLGWPLIPIVALVLSAFLYFVDRYEEHL